MIGTRFIMGLLFALALAAGSGAALAQPADAAPDDPQQHLRQILDDPLYQQWKRRQRDAEEGDGGPGYLDRWLEKLREWLRSLRDEDQDIEVGAGGGGGSALPDAMRTLGWIALIAVAAAIAVILFLAWRNSRAGPTTGHAVTRRRLAEAMETGEALAAGADRWLAEADSYTAEADLRRALRALYLGLLSGLHRRRRIDFRRTRTNWHYVHHFQGEDDHRRRFAGLTRRFDDVWYGEHVPESDEVDRVRGEVRTLLQPGGEA